MVLERKAAWEAALLPSLGTSGPCQYRVRETNMELGQDCGRKGREGEWMMEEVTWPCKGGVGGGGGVGV